MLLGLRAEEAQRPHISLIPSLLYDRKFFFSKPAFDGEEVQNFLAPFSIHSILTLLRKTHHKQEAQGVQFLMILNPTVNLMRKHFLILSLHRN